ncbi:MAG: hypothetical protein AAGE76_15900 [Pseudomonadota bacterium]
MAAALAIGLALAAAPAAALSNAAQWLIEQENANACIGARGRLPPEGVVELDLTGDGRPDLLLDLGTMVCPDGSAAAGCAAAGCPLRVFVRSGDLLLPERDLIAESYQIGPQPIPVLTVTVPAGAGLWQWNGERLAFLGSL